MIEVKNLTKIFEDVVALDRLSLHVDKGSVFGLVGANGSGKTTLIKHLTGIMKPDEGECIVDGENVFDNASLKERMCAVPDELWFFGSSNLKNMRSLCRKIYPKWSDERFSEMVKDFGLSETRKITRFSKGMQKQAAFIINMSACPDILILDEPMDGIDPIMRRKVWGYLLKDVADREMTVLISSHNLRELEGICDSIGILSGGKLLFQGKLDELKGSAEGMSLEELFFYEIEEGGFNSAMNQRRGAKNE